MHEMPTNLNEAREIRQIPLDEDTFEYANKGEKDREQDEENIKKQYEKQRDKYVQQAIDWLFTKEGNDFLVQAVQADAYGNGEETGIEMLIVNVLTRLDEKNPSSSKKELIEIRKFLNDFPDEVIKDGLKRRGIIDNEDSILLNEVMESSQK